MTAAKDLDVPLADRELSWIDFDRRVLDLARREDVPLLERLRFLGIAARNLDEFHMVRLARLERQVNDREDLMRRDRITSEARALGRELSMVLANEILPRLSTEAIRFPDPAVVDGELAERMREYHGREVQPCLTPIAVDAAHPFPVLRSGSLNLALRSRAEPDHGPGPTGERLTLLPVPSTLPRFVRFPEPTTPDRFVALEDVIRRRVGDVFPGQAILEVAVFRITRASDLDIVEDEAEDLLSTIENELRRRDRGEPVRLEISESTSWLLAERLRELLGLHPRQVTRCAGYLGLAAFASLPAEVDRPDLEAKPIAPAARAQLSRAPTIFPAIRAGDALLHHPYDAFRPVVDFLDQAAADPDVVAIKQTLYRTSGDSPVVRALARAAEAGKEVTVVVELKARFDEAANIAWARALEQSGAHVVYGLPRLETHAKMLLVTRREEGRLRRYLHASTGNYNPATARTYTDLSLFTADESLTHDAMLLFNVLTGYGDLPPLERLVVGPFDLRRDIIRRLDDEIEHVRAGRPAGLVAKMNALDDEEVIAALYRASRAGVPIQLLVRGVCSLIPGLPGVSPTIRVRSIIDRFLEHGRVFWWRNGGDDQVYLGSGNWTRRDLGRRIEIAFPILDPDLRRRIVDEILAIELRDDTFSWDLAPDGRWRRRTPVDGPGHRAQTTLLDRMEPSVPGRRTGRPPRRTRSSA